MKSLIRSTVSLFALVLAIFAPGCDAPTPAPAPAHSYGWHRSKKPSTHPGYNSGQRMQAGSLPGSLDLRPGCPPVYDQSTLGSCTANALGGLHQYLQIKQGLTPSFVPSRLMIYYGERAAEGTVAEDAGANGDDGVTFLQEWGVCPETTWPYVTTKFAIKPPHVAWTQGAKYKISGPVTLDGTNLVELKTYLAQEKIPIAFGFTCFPELESDEVAKSGLLPMPDVGEQSIGGHEVLLVGYDDPTQMFLVRNSWGATWGIGGYFWMPYSYVTNANLSGDFRSATHVN